MNTVSLIGRICTEVELKEAGTTSLCKFTVATPRMKKGESDFIKCVAFGKTAELIVQYFSKGKGIGINGHIQTGKYDKDGITIFTTDIIVDRLHFLPQDKQEKQENKEEIKGDIPADYFGMTEVNGDMPF